MPSAKTRLAIFRTRLAAVANLSVVVAAIIWRRTALRNVTLIAVTGSVGKTTASKCLTEILNRVGPTTTSLRASNGRYGIPALLLRSRPSHRFIVAEVGILKPSRMWRSAFVLKPDAVIITNIVWQHSVNFESLDHIAREKAKLLDPLPRNGLAILNADNPRVADMALGRDVRVRTFGVVNDADVVGSNIQAQWPDRLSLTVREGQESRQVQTQFYGTHWSPSVLAAVTAARALGVDWQACVEGVAAVLPFPARISPLRLPNGADLLRDEYNGSYPTFRTSLDLLAQARCARKVLAIGHIRDTVEFGDAGPEQVGKSAAGVADLLLVWGSFKERYRVAALDAGMSSENVISFETQPEMAEYIRRHTGAGDLIILKGFWNDHLSRIVFSQFGTVGCRLEFCIFTSVCDFCPKMHFVADPNVDPKFLKPLSYRPAGSLKK